MATFQYKNQIITYTLTRNAKCNVNFRIKDDGEICISAPKRISQAELNRMIAERAEWLLQNQAKIRNKKHNEISHHIQNGTTIILNGKKYEIHLMSGNKNEIHLEQNHIEMTIKEKHWQDTKYVDAYFDHWLKELMYYLGNRYIDTYLVALQKYHLTKPELTIRTMTSRWGSCTPTKGKITLNKNLIYPPHTRFTIRCAP